ncbi:tyrosine-protein phosphatase non-receptor type substrate 1-like [Notechis scutatus]|uniref:Tyrosine-protein phosphatase non-receptor type substrate 1-like n=1 Tax=Notechis scutatus TaxID=8663 RepID=A0A6J1W180_9SAUR|nr:tyrosine-protein phosphatase non-receptor type substrate 1-like [Notechis scutatus]
MACGVFLSGLVFVVLSSLSSARNGDVKAQDSWLWQPRGPVWVVIGEVLHLNCKVHNNLIPGGVKWFLGEGPQRKLIYADIKTDEKDKRLTRNSPNSNTDFTISIHNVTLEDAGTYYCVKEKKDIHGDKDWLKGPGTQVVVEVSRESNPIIPIAAGVSSFILVCLFCVALYVYLKMKKGLRSSHTRSEVTFPEKQQPSKQTSGDKEIVYADLKDPSGLQIPRKIDLKEHSEYATIKGAPPGAADKGTFTLHSLNP